jgi:hypothetical protein
MACPSWSTGWISGRDETMVLCVDKTDFIEGNVVREILIFFRVLIIRYMQKYNNKFVKVND